jgi:hypothetical protein
MRMNNVTVISICVAGESAYVTKEERWSAF